MKECDGPDVAPVSDQRYFLFLSLQLWIDNRKQNPLFNLFQQQAADMESITHLSPRLDPNQGCTKATCDATQSIYGYEPDLVATIIFLVVFTASGLAHLWQGFKTRTYFFSIAMAIGCLASVIGYIAKLLLHNDPFSDLGFKMSVVVLTFAPAFFAAGIYYTLKVRRTRN